MSKAKSKRGKRTAKLPTGAKVESWQFHFMAEPYEAGQFAGREALKRAPTCHEDCTLSAILSFWLGIMIPGCTREAETKRLSLVLLPHLLEAMSIVSKPSTDPEACTPPDATLN